MWQRALEEMEFCSRRNQDNENLGRNLATSSVLTRYNPRQRSSTQRSRMDTEIETISQRTFVPNGGLAPTAHSYSMSIRRSSRLRSNKLSFTSSTSTMDNENGVVSQPTVVPNGGLAPIAHSSSMSTRHSPRLRSNKLPFTGIGVTNKPGLETVTERCAGISNVKSVASVGTVPLPTRRSPRFHSALITQNEVDPVKTVVKSKKQTLAGAQAQSEMHISARSNILLRRSPRLVSKIVK